MPGTSVPAATEASTLDLQKLLAALASGARAVQALPSNSEDYDYETSFPEFGGTPLHTARSSWLQLVQSILRFPGLLINEAQSNDDLIELDNLEDPMLWDECAEACELLLEQIVELEADASDTSTVVSSLQKVSSTARSNAVSQWSKMNQLLVENLPKPQDVYSHLAPPVEENSRTLPFVPKIHPGKPFGIVPLPTKDNELSDNSIHISLSPGHGLETRLGPLRGATSPNAIPSDIVAPKEHCPHLYETEIKSFQYSNDQMQVNEQVKEFSIPTISPIQFVWICSSEALEHLVQKVNDENIIEIAIDLEAHSYRSFSGYVCLMQLTLRQSNLEQFNYLIDTLVIERQEITRLLAPIFANPNIVKILHGADHDIPWLQRDFGIYVVNLFDTGRAARHLGFTSASYAYLLKKYCSSDIVIDKSFQLADWRQRPLTSQMQQYAAQDTHHLPGIYDRIKVELFEKGGIEMIQEVLDTSRQVCLIRYSSEPFKPSGYRLLIKTKSRSRVGGKNKRFGDIRIDLNFRQEIVLRELWEWRDRTARIYDESLQYVCTNHALLRMALACPTSAMQLQALFNPMPSFLLHHTRDVITVVKSSLLQAEREQNMENKEHGNDDHNEKYDEEYESDDDDLRKNPGDNRAHEYEGKNSIRNDDFNESDEEVNASTMKHKLQGAPSSAFFKPAIQTDHEDASRRGMMSPVLGTEALYKQAGWMTPQEQIRQLDISRNLAIEYSTTGGTSDGETDDKLEAEKSKPRRLLSVHVANSEYSSKECTGHSLEMTSSNQFDTQTEHRAHLASYLTVVAASQDEGINISDMKSNDPLLAKELALQNASNIHTGMKDSVPVILGLSSIAAEAKLDPDDPPDDDDGESDDGLPMSKDERQISIDQEGGKNENTVTEEEFAVIPRSIREIYKISNRNRRNKKTESPSPESVIARINEQESEELLKAEALLKERGLIDDDGNSFLFDDGFGSVPGKRPRAKSGRESEESVPDVASNVASKEDDLAFMKEIGWISNNENIDEVLSQRSAKSRTMESNSREMRTGVKQGAEVRAGSERFSDYPAGISMGLIQPTHQLPGNNPFFSGAAMLGGPLTQGLAKPEPQRGRKNSSGRGKQNRGRQQERPEKRGDRTLAYRKK